VTPAALLVTGLGTGLLAGGASCAAVQGGLLAGAVARRGQERGAGQAPEPGHEPGPGQASGLARGNQLAPVAPVGMFLAGKLISHAALGAALGAFGAALQPSPRVRAILLLAAAALMVLFAVEMLGLLAVGRWLPRPPLRWVRLVRRSSRRSGAITPTLLGLATVLVPCGVTLSMELLAVTSGSPFGGAAVMAGFVIGTAPLFAVLGYLLRQSARIARGRLRVATGVVVIAVAAWTALSGLRLGGWAGYPGPPGGAAAAAASRAAVRLDPAGDQVITVQVRGTSYQPGYVAARPGIPTTLVLRSEHVSGCSRGFVIAGLGIQRILPPDGQTSIRLGKPVAGTLRYTCATGMYSGAITFTSGTSGAAPRRMPAPDATARMSGSPGMHGSPSMRGMLPTG
jgi:sulfite exporter TauE/SafE